MKKSGNSFDLAKYNKLDLIGKGSFGEVYKIKKKNSRNTFYAAKVSINARCDN